MSVGPVSLFSSPSNAIIIERHEPPPFEESSCEGRKRERGKELGGGERRREGERERAEKGGEKKNRQGREADEELRVCGKERH